MLVVVLLVLLRLAIGWHFFQEGSKKLREGKFTSAHFFRAAKGPWASFFRNQIPDGDGRLRLDPRQTDALAEGWHDLLDHTANRFDLDEQQLADATAALEKWTQALRDFHADNRDDLLNYLGELDRLEKAEEAPTHELASQRAWIASQRGKLRGQAAGWIARVDSFQRGFEQELYDIAGYEIAPSNPNHMPVDTLVTWLTFVVGVCLILGLFTPVAAVAGAVFLLLVMATQPPWVAGAEPIYNQAVEFLALLVLAATCAGRWFGLDFLVRALAARCCRNCCKGSSK